MTKRCPRCGETKPLEDFPPNRTKASGRHSYCRPCMNAYHRAWDRAHPEHGAPRVRDYRARNADRLPEMRRRWNQNRRLRDPDYSKRRYYANLEAARKVARDWYRAHAEDQREKVAQRRAADPEAIRIREREWRLKNLPKRRAIERVKSHRRRSRKAGNGTEPYTLTEIRSRDRDLCHICGSPVTDDTISIDHLIPILHGGPDTPWNVAIAHKACNFSRGAGRTPAQPRLPL